MPSIADGVDDLILELKCVTTEIHRKAAQTLGDIVDKRAIDRCKGA